MILKLLLLRNERTGVAIVTNTIITRYSESTRKLQATCKLRKTIIREFSHDQFEFPPMYLY